MQFRADDLIQVLKWLKPLVARSKHLPDPACVRFSLSGWQAHVDATDLQLYTRFTVPVTKQSPGEEGVEFAIPLTDLLGVLHAGSYVTLTPGDGVVEVAQSVPALVTSFKTLAPGEFPVMPALQDDVVKLTPTPSVWRDVVERVLPCTANDGSRPVLGGLLLAAEEDGVPVFGAADGFKMALHRLTNYRVEMFEPIIIPRELFLKTPKTLTGVRLSWNSDPAYPLLSLYGVAVGKGKREYDFVTVAGLIVGNFPDLRRIIPRDAARTTLVTVPRHVVEHATKQRKAEVVRFTPEGVRVSIAEGTPLEFPGTTSFSNRLEPGEPAPCQRISLSPEHLAPCLALFPAGDVRLELVGVNAGVVLRDRHTTMVVMPMVTPEDEQAMRAA